MFGAFGDKDVGEEYLSINSLTPFLMFSIQNSVSFISFPGATNITVASSGMLCFFLKSDLI